MDTIILNMEAFKLNDDEFFAFCAQNKGLNIERTANKEIVIMSPSGSRTSMINAELIFLIKAWNKKNESGIITDSNGGFYLPNGAMRAPDVAWIPRESWEHFSEEQRSKFLPYCPDFVIELKSPSDNLENLKAKMEEWTSNGTRLGWLIDPDGEEAYIYKPKEPVRVVKGFDNELDGEDVLPGFKLKLSAIKEF